MRCLTPGSTDRKSKLSKRSDRVSAHTDLGSGVWFLVSSFFLFFTFFYFHVYNFLLRYFKQFITSLTPLLFHEVPTFTHNCVLNPVFGTIFFCSPLFFFLPARTEFGEIALRNISFPIFAPLPPFTITFLCYLIGYRFSRYFLLRFLVGIATTCYYPCLTVVRASHAHTHISCYVRKSCHSSMRAGLERYDGNKIYTAGLFPPTFLL